MFHEEFKIISNGRELSYPYLRVTILMVLCILGGTIGGLLLR